MAITRIEYLYEQCMSGKATAEEQAEFLEFLRDPVNEAAAREIIGRAYTEYKLPADLMATAAEKMEAGIYAADAAPHVPEIQPIRRIPAYRKWVAAASVITFLGLGSYFLLTNKKSTAFKQEIAKAAITNDVLPGGNRAILTLANGSSIILDSVHNGTIATQGATQISKMNNGELAYKTSENPTSEQTKFNTLSTPRGGEYKLELPDGTKVWLNAASSITYPTAFTGNERNVKITGEVYFEVAHNAAKPFTVSKLHDDARIQVLGTHFNVNAYDDESALRVTLLEGSVKLTRGSANALLKPGQQAQLKNNSNDNIKIISGIDESEVMAWKSGKFQFGENTDITTIMRQVSRWYDVDVEYEGKVNLHFWGSMSRDVNVSQILKTLESTGAVHFKVEGKKVIVTP